MSHNAATEKQNYRTFLHLLTNTLFVSVIDFAAWFAITFYVFIETKSVFATAMIAGIYLVLISSTGIWFGSLVDHHKKKTMIQLSNIGSLVFYVAALMVYLLVPHEAFKDVTNVWLWILILLTMIGVIIGNIRTIVMPTMVTILIAEKKRDKANGLVGTVSGVSFLVTSVISGLLVPAGGMLYILLLAIVIITLGMIHVRRIVIPEHGIAHTQEEGQSKIDLKGTYKIVRRVPGLMALILFSTFNNFLGGVFMALMDAYGLSLMSTMAWGFLWAVVSTGLIIGGLVIAKTGLGKNPVRALLLANLIMWIITIIFPLQSSILMLAIGTYIYMLLIPYIEASEQTILQRVVPYERQGRVFGFAQTIEQSASPLTAFVIGPIAQFIFIPYMTTGPGVDIIGWWFGVGMERGIALVFIITAIIGVAATLIALCSKYYRELSIQYQKSHVNAAISVTTPSEAAQNGLK